MVLQGQMITKVTQVLAQVGEQELLPEVEEEAQARQTHPDVALPDTRAAMEMLPVVIPAQAVVVEAVAPEEKKTAMADEEDWVLSVAAEL